MSLCSGCNKEISGSEIQYTADARIVCDACAGRSQVASGSRPRWVALVSVGAALGAIPFLVHVSSSSTHRVNGVVTAFAYRDWVAVLCGAGAVLLGGAALFAARSATMRVQAIVAALAVIVLGGWQIARGLGAFVPRVAAPVIAPVEPTPVVDPNQPATCADKQACFALGRTLEQAAELPGAVIAYARACERGAAGGCFNAGLLAKRLPTPDFETTARMMKLGCELKDDDACTQLGTAYREGRGIAKDVQKAISLFGSSCERSNGNACAKLSSMYEAGEGMTADPELAANLAAKGCDEDPSPDLAELCAHAGVLLIQGDGVPHDEPRAVRYLTKACERSDLRCHGLAVVTARGSGTKQDLPAARVLYRKACDAGELGSCNNLGDLERRGMGGPKDVADAKRLYQQACDGGVELACDNLK